MVWCRWGSGLAEFYAGEGVKRRERKEMIFVLNLSAVVLSVIGTGLNLWGGWGLWKGLKPEDYEGKPVLFATSTVPAYMRDQSKFLGVSVIGTTLLLLSTVLLFGVQLIG